LSAESLQGCEFMFAIQTGAITRLTAFLILIRELAILNGMQRRVDGYAI